VRTQQPRFGGNVGQGPKLINPTTGGDWMMMAPLPLPQQQHPPPPPPPAYGIGVASHIDPYTTEAKLRVAADKIHRSVTTNARDIQAKQQAIYTIHERLRALSMQNGGRRKRHS
jgi:hypothetical protein